MEEGAESSLPPLQLTRHNQSRERYGKERGNKVLSAGFFSGLAT